MLTLFLSFMAAVIEQKQVLCISRKITVHKMAITVNLYTYNLY